MEQTSTSSSRDWLEIGGFLVLLLGALAVPLVVHPSLLNPWLLIKEYCFAGVAMVLFILWGLRTVRDRKLVIHRSPLSLALGAVLAATVLVGVTAGSPLKALIGSNITFSNTIILCLAGIALFVFTVEHVTTRRRLHMLLGAVMISGIVGSVFFLARVFFPSYLQNIIPGFINLFDSSNSIFGLSALVTFFLGFGRLFSKDCRGLGAVLAGLASALGFLALIALSMKFLWVLVIIGLLGLLVVATISPSTTRSPLLFSAIALTALCIAVLIFNVPQALRAKIPNEVALSQTASFIVAKQTLMANVKNALFGQGLGAFPDAYAIYRPASFNRDALLWSVRFNQPVSTLFAIVTEGGAVLFLATIFLVIVILGWLLWSWSKVSREDEVKKANVNALLSDEDAFVLFPVSSTFIVLTIAGVFFFFTTAVWWLWWLLLGLTAAGIALQNPIPVIEKQFGFRDSPERNLLISFVLIVAIAGTLVIGIGAGRAYLGEIAYSRGYRSTDPAIAAANFATATNLMSKFASYHVALAQTEMLLAVKLSRATPVDAARINALISSAIDEARKATTLAPDDSSMWLSLASVYEGAVSVVPDARLWVERSLTEAASVDPTNPLIPVRLGNNYVQEKNWTKAAEQFEHALSLKGDYTPAIMGIAYVYEQTKQVDKAIETYAGIPASAQNDTTLLFNYGRLLYNRNKGTDRDLAEKLWRAVIAVEPNNANTLYSLGLLLEGRGATGEALSLYRKVKELNPGSNDVQTRINVLTGKSTTTPTTTKR